MPVLASTKPPTRDLPHRLANIGVIWPSMDNVGQLQNSPTLAQEAIVGMLLAASGCSELPARPWPLMAACQTLANHLPPGSPYLSALAPAKQALSGEAEVESWIRALAERGTFRAQGRMTDARWIPSAAWMANWGMPAGQVPKEELRAWSAATQALTRCLSIWRKTVSAAMERTGPSAVN